MNETAGRGWGRSRRNRGFCGLPEQKSLISWPVMVGGIAWRGSVFRRGRPALARLLSANF
jgi:hypothetical protein